MSVWAGMPERATKRVAARIAMETFGKASPRPRRSSATVIRVGRAAALCLVLLGGLAAATHGARTAPQGTTTTAVTTSAATTLPASSVVVFSGHGWGHGLGLSQFGAYGYAKHGWTYDRILAHYYSGTTLGPAKISTVRVLIAE